MPLRRFRVGRYPDRYAVLDHGLPQGQTTVPVGAREGEQVPRYVAGDPDDYRTNTFTVWTSRDLSPESKQAARDECNRRNAEWESSDESPNEEVLSDLDYEPVQTGKDA